jgi:hypothetical protein
VGLPRTFVGFGIPFSPRIVAHAVQHYGGRETGSWSYRARVYCRVVYAI